MVTATNWAASATPIAPSMSIVARWEWRMFERSPKTGPSMVSTTGESCSAAQEETYLLACRTPHNVKIRAHRLQVKRLESVNAIGLEQWRPVLDVSLPVFHADLPVMCEALGIPMLDDLGRGYTASEIVACALARDPSLRVATVKKVRTPLTVRRCRGEHVTLTIEDTAWYSLAFEDADPALVYSVVQHFGLEHRPNRSYPALLKDIVGCSARCTGAIHPF